LHHSNPYSADADKVLVLVQCKFKALYVCLCTSLNPYSADADKVLVLVQRKLRA